MSCRKQLVGMISAAAFGCSGHVEQPESESNHMSPDDTASSEEDFDAPSFAVAPSDVSHVEPVAPPAEWPKRVTLRSSSPAELLRLADGTIVREGGDMEVVHTRSIHLHDPDFGRDEIFCPLGDFSHLDEVTIDESCSGESLEGWQSRLYIGGFMYRRHSTISRPMTGALVRSVDGALYRLRLVSDAYFEGGDEPSHSEVIFDYEPVP